MNALNIFTQYTQEENHFTNGLVSILSLSRFDNPQFRTLFFRDVLGLSGNEEFDSFRVLRGIEGTVDAELCGANSCVQIETKIVSGALDSEQINRHLEILRHRSEAMKRLILLTPDDSRSSYVRQFRLFGMDVVQHVSWRRVYDFLDGFAKTATSTTFTELVTQFVRRIHDKVFAEDIAGIIQKVDFGEKSEVYADRYLAEMIAGQWTRWNTPRQYKHLDGTGRKLMLYDRTRAGITLEVEIAEVIKANSEPEYPWTNVFAPGTIRVFDPPIPLTWIRTVKEFENFGLHRRDRSPYRTITHEQYRQLIAGALISQ